MERKVRIEVDRDDCIGCGLCEERAPDNLELARDEGVARVTAQPASEEQLAACLEAAEYCPIGALSVTDSDAPDPEEEDEHPSAAAAAGASTS